MNQRHRRLTFLDVFREEISRDHVVERHVYPLEFRAKCWLRDDGVNSFGTLLGYDNVHLIMDVSHENTTGLRQSAHLSNEVQRCE
jgi:hypothetical protein